MNDETLARLIYRANGAYGQEVLVERPLTETISWGRIWLQAPQPDESDLLTPNYYAYLIRDQAQRCVGLVIDHGEKDLHVYVPPHRRGRGLMSQALREVILPHLLGRGDRTEQLITISRNYGQATFEAAARAARAAGFEPLELGEQAEENTLTLRYRPAEADALPWIEGRNTLPTMERVGQLRRQLAYLASRLQLIGAEVELQLGDEVLTDDIANLTREVQDLGERIETATWAVARNQGHRL
ncbi:GNAT family N-acetyltransferase [Hymenobacter guriensis]|uniref:GNAT family N-acetyltransferase n=1 Tax=Hymenobacter guriensis TaxID=2793065 RepID=A0ABS0L4D2_9BACT|nr:hypothetical protein [Hymenobacter guriensis]MBG8555008.1 hypothetical protein [Hymenobacter guriensis]